MPNCAIQKNARNKCKQKAGRPCKKVGKGKNNRGGCAEKRGRPCSKRKKCSK